MRELQNRIQRAVLVATGAVISDEALALPAGEREASRPAPARQPASPDGPAPERTSPPASGAEQAERAAIEEALGSFLPCQGRRDA